MKRPPNRSPSARGPNLSPKSSKPNPELRQPQNEDDDEELGAKYERNDYSVAKKPILFVIRAEDENRSTAANVPDFSR